MKTRGVLSSEVQLSSPVPTTWKWDSNWDEDLAELRDGRGSSVRVKHLFDGMSLTPPAVPMATKKLKAAAAATEDHDDESEAEDSSSDVTSISENEDVESDGEEEASVEAGGTATASVTKALATKVTKSTASGPGKKRTRPASEAPQTPKTKKTANHALEPQTAEKVPQPAEQGLATRLDLSALEEDK